MVVTIHHDATDAGLAILHQGGNAVDAAVAVAFALAVVYPQAGNLGGGGFMLLRIHSHNGGRRGPFQTHFLDYREQAPAAASRDMYLDPAGNVIPGLSTVGYKASGVPGTVAGLVYAQSHFGRLSLAQDLAPAIRLATDGFLLSAPEADNLRNPTLTQFPASAHIFQRDGHFFTAGERFRTTRPRRHPPPDRRRPQHLLPRRPRQHHRHRNAEKRRPHHHRRPRRLPGQGPRPHPRHLSRLPILSAPPPSSGGIILVEILNILSAYNLPRLPAQEIPSKLPGSPDLPGHTPDRSVAQVHLITEAFRRAYMDRADYLGDPDFTPLPIRQMANKKYAAAWRASIDPNRPTPSRDLVRPAGFLPPPPTLAPAPDHPDTTHFSIVDADGNAVANTYTLNNTFGSAVTIAPLGFLMNDEMDDFASKQGVPNLYGLIQGPANAIGPGKRPLSAMTPTLVLSRRSLFHPRRRLRLVLGTPGGSTIITTVANTVISTLSNGLNIQQAADAPRFHHQYLPDRLDLEKTFPDTVAAQLAAMGYFTNRQMTADEHSPGTWGDCELIEVDPHTHQLLGGHDLRRPYGKAAGY